MKKVAAPTKYDASNETSFRNAVYEEDAKNLKNDRDLEMGTRRIVMTSPNGTRYYFTVSNAGAAVFTAV